MTTECRGEPRLDHSRGNGLVPGAQRMNSGQNAHALPARRDALMTTIVQARTYNEPIDMGRIVVLRQLYSPGISARSLLCDNATVVCDGDLTASRLSGSGKLIINGHARCDTLDFIGEIQCTGSITCENRLTVTGLARTQAGIDASHIVITGVVNAPRLFADDTVTIRCIGSGLSVQRAFPYAMHRSEIGVIDTSVVTAEHMVCDRIEAERIELNHACQVRVIPSSATLLHDTHSRVAFSAGPDGNLMIKKRIASEITAPSQRSISDCPARA